MAAKKKVAKRKTTKIRVLPKKMSSLIKIALKDITKAEKDKEKFIIDMSSWLSPKEGVTCQTDSGFEIPMKEKTVCILCLAGTVMAFTLGGLKKQTRNDVEYVPDDFGDNKLQLLAIDSLRQGDVGDAAGYLFDHEKWDHVTNTYSKEQQKYTKFDTNIPHYNRHNPKPFHAAMTKLQQKLEKAGL